MLAPEPSFELLFVNAQYVKNLPGRRTDITDAPWLASLLECGLLRGSFVPDPAMSRLRDLTRYRKSPPRIGVEPALILSAAGAGLA